MKYWKEKETSPVDKMEFWTGTYITKLAENEIFLYGSNPLLSFDENCPLYCPNNHN